jgi:hypothetical protein
MFTSYFWKYNGAFPEEEAEEYFPAAISRNSNKFFIAVWILKEKIIKKIQLPY